MLLYGIVKEIHDYDVDVSLPNGITGYLPITNISAAYTDILRQLTDEDTTDEEVNLMRFCSVKKRFEYRFEFV